MWPPTLLIWALLPILLGPSVSNHPLTNDSAAVRIYGLNNQNVNLSFSNESSKEEAMPNDDDAGEYLINTAQCQVKRHPLFDNETTQFYERFPDLDAGYPYCPLISSGIERVNFTWIHIPQPLLNKGCSATRIERDSTNDGVKNGQRVSNLNATLIEFPDWDAALVECGQEEEEVVVALIPDKTPFNYSDLPKPKIYNKKPINVLMLGIDSVSRLNFKRHFLKTDAFLKHARFQPFYGHHKVGDNSAPNMFPMMLGEHFLVSRAWLNQKTMDVLDLLPFIQKYYSNAGYLTTYNEDSPDYGLFKGRYTTNLAQHMGHQLTEYYMRPVNLELWKRLYGYCYQNQLEAEYYYDYILDLLRAHQIRGHAHFTWIHISALIHDSLNACQYLDLPLHRFLSAIFNESLHSNTIIMLYSDHEMRISSPIDHTDSGFHEERLPVLYVYTAENVRLMNESGHWLDADDLRQTLAGNAHSLTSHMDIHATLRHILTGNPPPSSGSNVSDVERYGKSLFTPISPERTCADAGIPPSLCLCDNYQPFTNKTTAESIAKGIVKYINQNILAKPVFKNRCQQLEFARITQAKMRSEQSNQNSQSNDLLLLKFATTNGAEFAVNFPRSAETATATNKLMIQIERVNRYAEQSVCVRHLGRWERFCVCK